MIHNLDENLSSTWFAYADYLKDCIIEKKFKEGTEFSEKVKHPELTFTSSSYALYWALLYAYNNDLSKALEIIKKAHDYGYRGFWKFDADSHGWSNKDSKDYLLLEPIHKSDLLQNYVKSVYTGRVEPWGFELATTPLCWFEKMELGTKNAKCYISNKRLQKGEQVYSFRFFNGSYGIPKELHYARIETFENNLKAKETFTKYISNTYKLSDYTFKIRYRHPLINFFWHNIKDFDLLTTLKLIAKPPVNPTPYLKYAFEERPLPIYDKNNKENNFDKNINYGTGGEFLNLLYVLVKCGYLENILSLLPQLPEHFPYLFLFFNSKNNIYKKIGDYLQEDINELSHLLEIGVKSYNKKSLDEVFRVASYGRKHPNFLKQFSTCLNNHECHLYSNYHPGVNWFFQEFNQFMLAKGGGLLDFFITAPELIPSLQQMKSKECYLKGFSKGAVDAYNNSLPFLYRTIVLNAAFEKSETLKKWIDLPEYIRNSEYYTHIKRTHKHTLKNIKTIANIV